MTTTMVVKMNYTQQWGTLPPLLRPSHQNMTMGVESKGCIHGWKLCMSTWKGHTCMDETWWTNNTNPLTDEDYRRFAIIMCRTNETIWSYMFMMLREWSHKLKSGQMQREDVYGLFKTRNVIPQLLWRANLR
jgi:hypothetical protein